MKKLGNHIFALALLLSFIVHLGLMTGSLIPALLSSAKTEAPPKRVTVRLQALSLDDAPPPVSFGTPAPPGTSFSTPPDLPPVRPSPSFGSGLRAPTIGGASSGNGIRPPHTPKSQNQWNSSPFGGTSFPDQQAADAATAQHDRQASEPTPETAKTNHSASQSAAEQSKAVTANSKPPGAGGKPQGARDAQGMIVATQPLGRLPDSATLTYLEEHYGVPGTIQWQRDASGYKLTLSIKVPFNAMQYQSSGQIDSKLGLQPQLFQETRNGKIRRSAKFDWSNHLLHFGDKGEDQAELHDGAQDLLSLSWQLALKGAKLDGNTQLTNGRKVYEYPIRAGQGAVFDGDNGQIRAQIIETHYDDQAVQVWLAPDFANIPIRIVFNKPDGPKLDLQITGITLNGVEEWGRPDKQMKKRD